jgi:hypothetical protein
MPPPQQLPVSMETFARAACTPFTFDVDDPSFAALSDGL